MPRHRESGYSSMNAAFQHRHYEALAKVLGRTRPKQVGTASYFRHLPQWDLMTKEIIKMLTLDNRGFDMDRFLKAVHKEASRVSE